MKYKEIFKKWWFYALIILFSMWHIFFDFRAYESLNPAGIIARLIGSAVFVLVIISVLWGAHKIITIRTTKEKDNFLNSESNN